MSGRAEVVLDLAGVNLLESTGLTALDIRISQRITLDKGVLDVAEQGEDHAGKEYEKALAADISTGLRTVVERQLVDVRSAHDQVKALRDAHA